MKKIDNISKQDLNFLNELIPPTKGVDVGEGIHVVISEDWEAQIASGKRVPGCTYIAAEVDGRLVIDDSVRAKLNDTSRLSAGDKVKAAALLAKEVEAIKNEETRIKDK